MTHGKSVVVPLSGAPYGDDFLQAINGFATGGSTRCRDAIEEAGASVAFGALSGGDYTMVLAEKQPFEAFPALAQHIERMAVGGSVGSLIEWDAFLRELNAAIAAAPAPSSLAGGSFGRDQSTLADLTRTLEMCERGEGHNPEMVSVHVSTFRDLLAALSPEAPAEGAGELLPCPFCGEDTANAYVFARPGVTACGERGKWHGIKCHHCGAEGATSNNAEKTAQMWNRRARSSAPEARDAAN
jgi:Lar family restriction alleviation protein